MTTTTRKPLVEAYQQAQAALDSARAQWNALPTPEARQASGISLDALHRAHQSAVGALLADAAGRHRVEERSVVYLRLDENAQWTIDSPTDDGYPLEGYDDGPLNEACEGEDEDDEHDEDECDAVRAAAQEIELPDARELRDLLISYLGD